MDKKNNSLKIDNSIWSAFTKKYPLNKTLRFELVPVGKTKEWLEKNNIFKKDLNIYKSYKQAKFYFYKLHQEFIEETLSDVNYKNLLKKIFYDFAKDFENKNLDLKNLKNKIKNSVNKKEKIELQDKIFEIQKLIKEARSFLYKRIVDLFEEKTEEWKRIYQNKEIENGNGKKIKIKFSKNYLKKEGVEFLITAGILNILKYKFPPEKNQYFTKLGYPSLFIKDEINPQNEIYIFNSFDKFTTYLSKFQETRKNIYKKDGTSTAVATRIVSNFERFLINKNIFEENYQNYKDFNNIGLTNDEIKIFEIDYYYNCLLQEGINQYNKIIGQINKKTKEYRDKNKIDKKDLSLFINLEKQILGEIKKERSFIEAKDEKTKEQVFVEKLQEFIKENNLKIEKAKELVKNFTQGSFENDYPSIYLKRNIIIEIVNKWFANSKEILLKLTDVKSEEKINIKKFISLDDFKNTILSLEGNIFKARFYKTEDNLKAPLKEGEFDNWKNFLKIWQFEFESLFEDKFEKDKTGDIKKDKNGKPIQIFWGYTDDLEKKVSEIKFYSAEKEQIKIIKNYCDAALRINKMMRYFNLSDKDIKDLPSDLSTEFYSMLDEYFRDFEFNKYYNEIRNFITRKPSDENKIKLNFESGQLFEGWDVSKEKDYLGLIFIKNNSYYLGILNKNQSKIFDYQDFEKDSKKEKERKKNLRKKILTEDSDDYYYKMNYWQIADAGKDIYNLVLMPDGKVKRFTKKEEKNKYWPEYIKQIKEKKTYTNKNLIKQDLIKFIDYFKECALIYWKKFDLKLKSSEVYGTFKEFINDINLQGYKIGFDKIKSSYIEEQVNCGNLYLFKIQNKDFYEYKKPDSNKNLHTLYFEYIFDNKNLSDYPLIRINGKAEVFYREPLIIEEDKKLPVVLNRENNFKNAIRNNKIVYHYNRYLTSKYLFHCPITLNATCFTENNKFNLEINNFIKNNFDKINIIGIDRGEKNLLYYCVINQNQEILDYGSLNEINGVNYFEKLIEREKQRRLERQSWEPVVKIKDLKKGYLSYVIRKICDLIIKHNAIVVLEDLSKRFKQIRNGIERTVYQQFEKMLIDKLNYLVFKDNKDVFSPAGILNGFQLTAPFTSFIDIEKVKQTGVLFYTNAEYTSQTDPLTGFRKNIYISNSASQEKIKELINKLKEFGWDNKKESYFIKYNPVDFVKKGEKNIDKDWIVWTKVPRVIRWKEYQSSYWSYREINLNQEFDDLLRKYNFESKSKNILVDLKNQIKQNDKLLREKKDFNGKQKNFYERFVFLFNLIFQIRNTISLSIKIDRTENKIKEIDYGIDFFASPVEPFFSTFGERIIGIEKNAKLEKEIKEVLAQENLVDLKIKKYNDNKKFDSDGVGAYNIARKGLIILEKIKENPEKPNLFISRYEWDKFIQR